MNTSKLKARSKYTNALSDYPEEKTVKLNKRNINKYNRILSKREIDSEYSDFVLNEEDENKYLYEYWHEGEYFEEYLVWSDIDLDNLPKGVTFEEYGCDGFSHNDREYSDKYDSSYCRYCNIWLEASCSDENCEFCSDRPDKPMH